MLKAKRASSTRHSAKKSQHMNFFQSGDHSSGDETADLVPSLSGGFIVCSIRETVPVASISQCAEDSKNPQNPAGLKPRPSTGKLSH